MHLAASQVLNLFWIVTLEPVRSIGVSFIFPQNLLTTNFIFIQTEVRLRSVLVINARTSCHPLWTGPPPSSGPLEKTFAYLAKWFRTIEKGFTALPRQGVGHLISFHATTCHSEEVTVFLFPGHWVRNYPLNFITLFFITYIFCLM